MALSQKHGVKRDDWRAAPEEKHISKERMAKFARGTLTEGPLPPEGIGNLPRKNLPFAICYDFDGTLAPGNMQERDFIPAIGMTTKEFWDEVRAQSARHQADSILIYMWLMLRRADAKQVQVRKKDFETYGKKVPLFPGVTEWFKRIDVYGQESGVKVQHYIISSGIREMIAGTPSTSTLIAYMRRRLFMTIIVWRLGLQWP